MFVPFVRLKDSSANWLTNNAYDETARIPEFKVCAVTLERADDPQEWRHTDSLRRRGKRRQYW